MRRLVAVVLSVAVAAGFYMVLIDTTSLPELYAGCGVVLLAVLGYLASLEQGFAEAAISGQWLIRAWRPFAKVPGHIVLLVRELVAQLFRPRRVRGSFRAIPFRGGDRPEDRGRQALSEILGSLAPNTIVIGVDSERELLLVHQLHRTPDSRDLDVLRLG